jgi:hypothetical protein
MIQGVGRHMVDYDYVVEDWWCIFASGDFAQFIKDERYMSSDGRWIHRFMFYPNRDLIQNYDLKWGQEIDERTGLIMSEYPDEYVDQPILMTAKKHFYFIEVDFLGRQTGRSQKTMHLTEKVINLQQQVRTLRMDNHRLRAELEIMTNRTVEYIHDARRIVKALEDEKPSLSEQVRTGEVTGK